MPPSVAGSRGHDAAWQVAQVIVRGFMLSEQDAWTVMTEFNGRCQPAWSDVELKHKLEQARTKSRLPWGYIVNAARGTDRGAELGKWQSNDVHRDRKPGQQQSGNGAPGAGDRGVPGAGDRGVPGAGGHHQHANGDGAAHGQPPPDKEEEEGGYELEAIDSKTFFANNYKLEWLVKGILVRGQPAGLGGPRKTLKTSLEVDLAISLATGTDFLGKFKVPERRKVLLISGESGEAVLQETGRRVCEPRGVDPGSMDVHWAFKLPQVANSKDLHGLQKGLQALKPAVAMIDPLYLCLLAGVDAKDVNAGNLFHVGPLLSDLSQTCLDAGGTPILCHHTRKNLAEPFEPIELEELAWAGMQEFLRQWILVNRRAKYEPGTGSHKLWMSVGGSVGHGNLWAVDIEEGTLNDDFTGRRWEVEVHTATEAREGAQDARADREEKKRAKQVKQDGTAVLGALDRLAGQDGWAVYSQVRSAAHLNGDRMTRAALGLEKETVIERGQVSVATGKGHKVNRPVEALRRVSRSPDAPTFILALGGQEGGG
jgi:replicative DNA helicase